MPRQKKQVLKERKDGRYACKYHGHWFMGHSSDEALAAREAYKLAELRGELIPQPDVPTVGAYIPQWLKLHKSHVSDKCHDDYAKQLESLLPVMGTKPFDQVTPDDAAAVWQHYQGMSASTIKRARMLFISLFDTAIDNEYCTKNPFRAKSAQPHPGPSGTHRQLTPDEISLVQNTPHRMQAAVMVMLYAGLRRGEVLALTVDDVDLKHKLITVNKSLRFDGNAPVIVPPKTAAGQRKVPILSVLQPILAAAVADHPRKKGQPAPVLVPSTHGAYMTSTAWKRAWDSYIYTLTQAAGTQVTIRPHDLRHTYCTLLADAGVSIKQAMAWMGHADEKMILHVYDHLGDKRAADSIARVETALIGRQNGRQRKKLST